MAVFARSSSSAVALAFAAALASGCTETLPPFEGTSSLQVDLVDPSDPGSADSRLDDSQLTVKIEVTPIDTAGEEDLDFSGEVDVYVHYLGNLTPPLGETPLASAMVKGGASNVITVDLPRVFGPSFLWVEHTRGDDPTYATGTSPTLWYREPFLEDVSRPEDEMALDALESSPLEDKQVVVSGSRYGDAGRLVATGIYAQGYTLSDVECQDASGTPPCTAGPYDHVFVFSFSRAEIDGGGVVQRGQVVSAVGGGVSEFNGLTEIGFPQTFVDDKTLHPELVPEPAVLQPDWLGAQKIEAERHEAALVAVEDAVVCPLDDDFETYSQWKLDVGNGCDDISGVISVISKGEVSEFSPADYTGQALPRVVGTLRPINIGSFNVWLLYPRDIDDFTLP